MAKVLKALREASGDNVSSYNFHEYVINASSLRKGLKYYDIALRIYMGAVLKRAEACPEGRLLRTSEESCGQRPLDGLERTAAARERGAAYRA